MDNEKMSEIKTFDDITRKLSEYLGMATRDITFESESFNDLCASVKHFVRDNQNEKEKIDMLYEYFDKIQILLEINSNKRYDNPDDLKLVNNNPVNVYSKMVKKLQ